MSRASIILAGFAFISTIASPIRVVASGLRSVVGSGVTSDKFGSGGGGDGSIKTTGEFGSSFRRVSFSFSPEEP
ncbi:hypothetical protein ES703_67430 [subsurface metagenome]